MCITGTAVLGSLPASADAFSDANLGWCSTDWGYNEGAQEAVAIANAVVAAGYPNLVSGIIATVNGVDPHIAGNILKRPPVLDAARAIAGVLPDLAVSLAATCQAHNPPVKSYLLSHRDDVRIWLLTNGYN
jgi:hypothetical protein